MKKNTLTKWRNFVEIISSEWILTQMDIPNGGAVILLRALISSLLVFSIILALFNIFDPERTWQFSYSVMRTQIIEKFTWLGVIFGAIYTALYARFSSQWTYLANLYNSIKQAEVSVENCAALSEWKAGFIEDAENLHMACKGSFVSIVKAWGNNKEVEEKYIAYAPGGKGRFERLMLKVEFSANIVDAKFKKA